MIFSEAAVEEMQLAVLEAGQSHHRIRESFVRRQFANPESREHADHGFSRRVGTLLRCLERVFEILPPDREDVPSRDETMDASVCIQAFLMNVFGCCENLAWIWVLERGVTGAGGKPLSRYAVGLGPGCTVVRSSFSDAFRAYLDSRTEWFEFLKDFRDALAHRIPLYIPPFMVPEKDAAKYEELGKAVWAAALAGDVEGSRELDRQQDALGVFQPMMKHTLTDRRPPIVFHPQLVVDFRTIIELADEFLAELDRP